jgi:hypothetical protein
MTSQTKFEFKLMHSSSRTIHLEKEKGFELIQTGLNHKSKFHSSTRDNFTKFLPHVRNTLTRFTTNFQLKKTSIKILKIQKRRLGIPN